MCTASRTPSTTISPVVDSADIVAVQEAVRQVHVAASLKGYLVDVADATRRHPRLSLPVSPRATLALLRASRARAAALGRAYVVPDDIKALAEPVLAHRLLVTAEAQLGGVSPRRRPRRSHPVGRGPLRPGEIGPRALVTRTGWLVLLGGVAAVVAGRLLGLVELYVVGVGCAALVGLAFARVASTRLRLEIARHVTPRRVHAGQPARVELTVSNRAEHVTPVLRLHDPVSGTQGATVFLAPVDDGVTVRSAYRLPTDRRGVVAIGPLAVVVTDPFGIASVRADAAPQTELIVLPRIDDIVPPPPSSGDEPLSGVRVGRRWRRPAATTSPPCGSTSSATTSAASTGRRRPATATCSCARTRCTGRAARRSCSTPASTPIAAARASRWRCRRRRR